MLCQFTLLAQPSSYELYYLLMNYTRKCSTKWFHTSVSFTVKLWSLRTIFLIVNVGGFSLNTTPGARLDVSARNLWSPLAKAFIDVRIFNPQAKTNWDRSIPQMYTSHENEKKTEYLPRVLQVEKATFTPAVFSTSGGIGKEADKLIRRMAERMSAKRGETYSSVVSFLRRRFRFDLLKTCIIALRGYKKPSSTPAKIETLDMDLRGIATSC